MVQEMVSFASFLDGKGGEVIIYLDCSAEDMYWESNSPFLVPPRWHIVMLLFWFARELCKASINLLFSAFNTWPDFCKRIPRDVSAVQMHWVFRIFCTVLRKLISCSWRTVPMSYFVFLTLYFIALEMENCRHKRHLGQFTGNGKIWVLYLWKKG